MQPKQLARAFTLPKTDLWLLLKHLWCLLTTFSSSPWVRGLEVRDASKLCPACVSRPLLAPWPLKVLPRRAWGLKRPLLSWPARCLSSVAGSALLRPLPIARWLDGTATEAVQVKAKPKEPPDDPWKALRS